MDIYFKEGPIDLLFFNKKPCFKVNDLLGCIFSAKMAINHNSKVMKEYPNYFTLLKHRRIIYIPVNEAIEYLEVVTPRNDHKQIAMSIISQIFETFGDLAENHSSTMSKFKNDKFLIKTKDAIKRYGSKSKLAKTLGIQPQCLTTWGEYIPKTSALKLKYLEDNND